MSVFSNCAPNSRRNAKCASRSGAEARNCTNARAPQAVTPLAIIPHASRADLGNRMCPIDDEFLAASADNANGCEARCHQPKHFARGGSFCPRARGPKARPTASFGSDVVGAGGAVLYIFPAVRMRRVEGPRTGFPRVLLPSPRLVRARPGDAEWLFPSTRQRGA
jgi:hypothetical protein